MSNKSVPHRSARGEKRQCEAILKSGQRCRAWALRSGRLCSLHDPRNAAKVKEGRKRGGRMPRSKVLAKELKEIKTFEDLLEFLNRLIRDTYSGAITAKQSQAVTTALSGIKSTIEAMIPPGGGRIPSKLYDFDTSAYEEEMRRVLIHPKGRWALRIINALKRGEEIPKEIPETRGEGPRIPSPRPEKTATHEETPSFPLARVDEAPGAPISAEPIQEAEEKAPKEEKIEEQPPEVPEEPPEEEKAEKDEEHSTVKFTDTEAFWEMLERQQRK